LSLAIASIESYLCRELSVNCSVLQGHVVSKICLIFDFRSIPLPRKLFAFSHIDVPVMPVIPVPAANFSWRNSLPLVAKKSSSPKHVCSHSSCSGLAREGQPCLFSPPTVVRLCRFPLPFFHKSGYNSLWRQPIEDGEEPPWPPNCVRGGSNADWHMTPWLALIVNVCVFGRDKVMG
jgi:hypothetical protein